MKDYIVLTKRYGYQVIGTAAWGRDTYFFDEPTPPPERLVKIDPREANAWIGKGGVNARAGGKTPLIGLPSSMWELATLDDVLTATNFDEARWGIGHHFPLEDFQNFISRWLPWLEQSLVRVVSEVEPASRLAALDDVIARAERIATMVGSLDRVLEREREPLATHLDRITLARLMEKPFDPDEWVASIAAMKGKEGTTEALDEWARRLAATPDAILPQLRRIEGIERLHDIVAYRQDFWKPFLPVLRLPPNVSGERIAIASAKEESPSLGWDLLNARRVGVVVPGRTALVLRDGSTVTYIVGERKLKHRVLRAGGELERLGNTLVMESTGEGTLERLLVEVERLMTLAQVDPAQVAAALSPERRPDGSPIAVAAARAVDDPRYRHILAGLLIEEVTGLDADVARAHIRDRSRGNRR